MMGVLLAAATIMVYLPILQGGFIWDDNNFLTANPLIHAPDGLRRLWFTTEAPDYWPLTSTSLWLEWRLWGLHAEGYHATNVVLHAIEVVLLWSTLRRLRLPGAYLAALIFALHPVNVETVAWITQRKNLLAMLFYLVSIRGFLETDWSGLSAAVPSRSRLAYAVSLGAFVLALLSKGSVAPLPLVLLGIIAWSRRLRFGDAIRIAPYFVAAVAFTLVNMRLQAHDYAEFRHADPLERTLGAGAALWFYLGKALCPLGLSFVYPLWTIDPKDPAWWAPVILAAVFSVALAWAAIRRPPAARGAAFAWAYYVALLLPVLGFTDVGFMKFSLVADHYQHLALLGIAALVGSAATLALARLSPPARPAGYAVCGAAVASLGILTFLLSATYADARVLYEATLKHNPRSSLAHNNLGIILSRNDSTAPQAVDHFTRALEADPRMAEAHYNLALLLARIPERRAEAIAHGEQAIRLNPRLALAHVALGNLLATEAGRVDEAIGQYQQALRLRPNLAEAHYDLANALAAKGGRTVDAIAEYRSAIELNPDDVNAENNLANALASSPEGRDEAIRHYQRAIELNPENLQAQNNLAIVLASMPGRAAEAVEHFEAALRIEPRIARIHCNLANVLATLPGRSQEAAAQYEEALQLDPSLLEARHNLSQLSGGGR